MANEEQTSKKKQRRKKNTGATTSSITSKNRQQPPRRKPGCTKWKSKKNKTHERTVINQVLHALYMLWMESGMKPEEIFQTMDTDKDGVVTAREFRLGLQQLGLNIDAGDASIVFMEMDRDNSGELEYAEL